MGGDEGGERSMGFILAFVLAFVRPGGNVVPGQALLRGDADGAHAPGLDVRQKLAQATAADGHIAPQNGRHGLTAATKRHVVDARGVNPRSAGDQGCRHVLG